MTLSPTPNMATATTIKKAYADTRLGQLHYRYSHPSLSFATKPIPVLLLHMSASSSKSFESIIPTLTGLGYSCFAPDMPGFGSSFDPTTDPPAILWYASLYHDTFSSFEEFSNGCHIIGHHSGAVIGTELGAKFPSFCKSLTCVGPTIMPVADRQAFAKRLMNPFNKPVTSGDHLLATWNFLKGIPRTELELLQRETMDHLRAWEGRLQIYRCVWDYDGAEAMKNIPPACKVLGLCASNDILWPYFENFKSVDRHVEAKTIGGGNYALDLDPSGITEAFLDFIGHKDE